MSYIDNRIVYPKSIDPTIEEGHLIPRLRYGHIRDSERQIDIDAPAAKKLIHRMCGENSTDILDALGITDLK